MTHFNYFVISVKVNVKAHLLTVMFLSISLKIAYQNHLRDGPLENLWWGRAKYKKNIRAREN